ncbi:glycine oxidase ThiO [Oleiphilus sp. HI0125]|uniref:glycine oxidase ThiO n=2 Tax=Oleiphilus sp. HI0125 TaxID=1822266 RepID=UPI0007C2139A|nr:glycine oxidase ThiO [Oleiphilus sp. HI0125]KZZ56199.1 glycine oxidase ThiO [Oleiphilus sp. HI0125]
MKAIVVGAGVIGMLQARDLAHNGFDVVLYDQGQLGREASWAGGGIISPLYPWRYSAPVTALAKRSQAIYAELIEDLEAESGIDPEISHHGLLVLNVEDQQAALNWAENNASWMETISAEHLYDLEPKLKTGFASSLWMPKVASVRNPRLLRALRTIMNHHAAITVRENQKIAGIDEGRVSLLSGEIDYADLVVVCSGAWTSQLMPHISSEIEPVKGQMLVFDAPVGLVNRVVLSDGRYVIPRKDGNVVAGSTLEYTGFEKLTNEEAKQSLIDSAISLFPSLAEYKVSHHWAGLRPGSPKGIPSIGRIDGYRHVYVNAGHFRNGLVLAPASVELLSKIIDTQSSEIDPSPYSVGLRTE